MPPNSSTWPSPTSVADERVQASGGPEGAATLVVLDTAASAYDRQTYPKAALAAFVSSDHPDLTAVLLSHLPASDIRRGTGIVFKLSNEADLASGEAVPEPDVRVTSAPGDDAFRLFETQGHDRAWLKPLLENNKAFACVAGCGGEVRAACIAFENHGPVWEVGGVVTASAHRRQGLGQRIVRAALAELGGRGLAPRYQVEENNTASIGLARSVGLAPFLTIVHYAHDC